MKLRVAGFQMAVGQDVETNARQIIAAIDRAEEEEADILLTPEGSLSGYTHAFDACAVRQALGCVTEQAQERRVGLALGTCFVEDDGECYNEIRFYRRDGEYLGFHSKTLRCGTLETPPKGEIEHYACTALRVFPFAENLPIGGLICNDMWANPGCTPMPDPHLSQQLMQMGARVIFHAVNGGRSDSDWSRMAWDYHETNLRMRARAGSVWVVTVDSSAPEELPCSAPSGVIDPTGTIVCKAPPRGAQFFVHDICLD